MPTLQITFSNPLNTSLQVGDTAYYVSTNPAQGNFITASQTAMVEIGQVINISNPGGPVSLFSLPIPNGYVGGNTTLIFNNPTPPPGQIQSGQSISGTGIAPNTSIVTWSQSLSSAVISTPTTGPITANSIINFSAPTSIQVFNSTSPIPTPNTGDFIMFAKNRVVNTSGIIGYYADVNLINNSTQKAEIFALSSGIIESSK